MNEGQWISTYRDTIQPLYSYISRRTGGERELTEDIVQETYLRALNQWIKKRTPDNPLAWLKKVGRNLLISHLRKRRWEKAGAIDFDPVDDSPSFDNSVKTMRFYSALSGLKRSYRNILELFYFEGRSVREIAAEMAVSERAVEGRLRRARQSLRSRLSSSIHKMEVIKNENKT